jgi:hypothetical protein
MQTALNKDDASKIIMFTYELFKTDQIPVGTGE